MNGGNQKLLKPLSKKLFCSLLPRRSTIVSIAYSIWSGLILWSLEGVVLTPISLSQVPQTVPTPPRELLGPQSPEPTFRPGDVVPQGYSAPAFNVDTSDQFTLYRLGIGDSLSVSIRDFPEFNFSAAIDPEGQVRVPFLGKIAVVGLTLDEVQTKVAYELGRRYLQEEPEVVATLIAVRPVQLTILGEIVRPGYYFFQPGITLNNVIQSVGGSTPRADLRSIIVRRRLVDGTVIEEKLDLYTPLLQGTRLPDFRLQGGDTIIVSRLEVGQKDYDQTLISQTTLAQPAITVRVLVPIQPSGLAVRSIRLPNGSTFLDAIASLPSASPLLTKEEVTLLRFDPDRGRVVSQTLNPINTVQNLDVTQYVALRDEDVIVVSRTLLGQILSAFRVITQPIRDLLGFSSFITGLSNNGLFGGDNNNNNNNFLNNNFF